VHELVRELVHDQVHELVRELVHDQVRDLVRDEDASLARLLEQEQARMAHLDELDDKARESPHVRAVKLRARMRQYSSIYNAAWHVRAAQHGAPEQRARKIADFVRVLRAELERTKDQEAFIYAVADALTAYPRGLPWES
jgi:type I site-specific restriction endonuclease